ncbi:hypothetical protein LXL04_000415 [Taraxacum kok-saghyz]
MLSVVPVKGGDSEGTRGSRFGIPQVSDSLCEPTNPGTDRLWTTVNGGDDQELSVANLLGHKCNQPVSNSGPSSEESVK